MHLGKRQIEWLAVRALHLWQISGKGRLEEALLRRGLIQEIDGCLGISADGLRALADAWDAGLVPPRYTEYPKYMAKID